MVVDGISSVIVIDIVIGIGELRIDIDNDSVIGSAPIRSVSQDTGKKGIQRKGAKTPGRRGVLLAPLRHGAFALNSSLQTEREKGLRRKLAEIF